LASVAASTVSSACLQVLDKSMTRPHNQKHGCNSGNLEAFWTGVRFPSPPPKGIGNSVFGWGCTGFDRAGKGAQATRQAIDVNEANP
jgi:hypothetical protein